MGVELEKVRTTTSSWSPTEVTVPLQVALDACFVPTARGLRVDEANLVVVDGLIDSALQQQLLSLLTDDETSTVPPSARWEQRTVDDASNPHPSWGCRDEVLRSLKHQPAVMEVHARLARLYPDVEFHHMPADDMQAAGSTRENTPHTKEADKEHRSDRQDRQTGLCQQFVANAAVAGDQFVWHVDADPVDVPEDSAWVSQYGLYTNRINEHAETLFLDGATDTGVCVRPRPGRMVVMDQDVMHRVCAPSLSAKRPRYSLVWKLAVLRRSCAKKKSTPTTAATGVSVGCKRPQEDTLNTSNSTCFFQDNGEGDHVRETEARPLSEVPTQPSILLPSMGSVCYFGSARRMKDVQDGVCGTSR